VFELPRHVSDEPAAPKKSQEPHPLRILVIDGDSILLSLRDALAADGHTVTTAGAGIDAFRKAAEDGAPLVVVVTDLAMPYVDGRRVAKRDQGRVFHDASHHVDRLGTADDRRR
jgi:PleD family two-component response regulator